MGLLAAEVDQLLQASRLHLAKGEFHEAVGRATEVINRDAKQPSAYLIRAEAHRRLNRPERALADLAVAIRIDPNQPGPYVIRAEILKRRNQFDQAITDATHALTVDPRNAAAFSIRAECRCAIGDHDGASHDVQEMLVIDPTRPVPNLQVKTPHGDSSPAIPIDDKRFWKESRRQSDISVFADGKEVDKTYRSVRSVSDDDAPEALGVASGYKPGTISTPIPRIRLGRRRSNPSWIWLLLGLAGTGFIGFLLANRNQFGAVYSKKPSFSQTSRAEPSIRERPTLDASDQPIGSAAPESQPKQDAFSRRPPATTEMTWTYLVELPRIEVTHQNEWWSDKGELLLGGGWTREPLIRKPLQFGIYLHARPSGNATITYRLRKRFSSFRSQVVIPEMLPRQGDPRTPLVFKIQGDGRVLWRSKPLSQKGDNQTCKVSVEGVDELSLLIDCPGPENWGLGAWIEPQLSVRQTTSISDVTLDVELVGLVRINSERRRIHLQSRSG